jgi:anti-sigma regulatory factor (Ser/Thr protein kinase)/HAMP domain-containing protein
LASALAVPLVALVSFTMLEVVQTSDERGDTHEQTDLARGSIGPTGLLISLQNERTWPSIEILEFEDRVTAPVPSYEDTRAQTDAARASFEELLEGRVDAVQDTFRPALDGLDGLDELRAEIDAFNGGGEHSTREIVLFGYEVFDRYTEMISPFFDASTRIARAVADPELRQGAELADAVARQIETTSSLMYSLIANALLTPEGVDLPGEITELSVLRSDLRNQAAIMRGAHGAYEQIARQRYPEDLLSGLDAQVELAISTHRIHLETMLETVNVPTDDGLFGYQDAVHGIVNQRADQLNDQAASRQLRFGMLALVALLLAAGLTWLVSRSITGPLRSLTRQAKEMADRRLPDAVRDVLEMPLGDNVRVPEIAPVTVFTRDEVVDVAEALNTVQDSALDLAVEQAVLRRNIADSFVNLGRRNQNLLGRQLDFITELESREADADALGSLFQLDHLATRMRRNAESLLVLAGVEPPRKWTAPVRLADVIRSALGEVEDYQRVVVRGLEPVTVVGIAAADLTHLIAELVENALSFSPTDKQVDVRGRRREDTGGYSVTVIDHGFGMTPGEILQANRRLAGDESFTVAPSKYLGHYVAGNLARRLNVHIHLDQTPGGGITVTVELPPGLLEGGVEDEPSTPPNAVPSIAARAALDAGSLTDTNEPPPPPAPPGPPPVRTASGLIKRVPQAAPPRGRRGGPLGATATATAGAGSAAAGPAPADGTDEERSLNAITGEMLTALTEHANRARTDARRPTVPAPGREIATGGLTRRVAGAQMPATEPLLVHRGPSRIVGDSGEAPASAPASTPAASAGGWGLSVGGTSAPSGEWAIPDPGGSMPAGEWDVPSGGVSGEWGIPGAGAGGASGAWPAPTSAPGPAGPAAGGPGAGGPAADRWGPPTGQRAEWMDAVPPPAGESQSGDVYSFLSGFTSGVQRGLDEAREGADEPPPPPHPGPPGEGPRPR